MRTDDRRTIQNHFAAYAEPYVDGWAPILLSFAAPLFASLPAGAETILDLGCGPGVVTRALRERFGGAARIVGADLVPEMLRRARTALPDGGFVRVDAPRLPFGDHRFDVVASTFVFQHVREQPRTLSEVFRVLKPGGALLLVTWGREDPGCGAFEVWEEALMEHGASADDPDPSRRWDESIDTPDALRALLDGAGFTIESLDAVTPSWTWTPESLEFVRTGLGAPSRRLRALPPAKRNAFLADVRRRLKALETDDFVWAPAITRTVCRRPGE